MAIRKSVQLAVFLIAFVFTALIPSLILAAEESITLTTYYPSPYGVYSEMRLYPKADASTPCDPLNPATQVGVMYYDNTFGDEGLKVCGGSPPAWQPVGGGGGYWTLSSNNLYATNTTSWNVGIGTGSPGTKLSVRVDGNGANAVLRLSSILSSWTAGYGPRLLFHGGSDDRVFGEIGSFLQNTGTGANAYMTFSTRDSEVLGERMRINSAGLDVTGKGGASVAIFEDIPVSEGYGGELFLQARNNANARIPYASIKAYVTDGSTGTEGGALLFKTMNTSLVEKMRIDRSGNVGIGTTLPRAKLHLMTGGSPASDNLRIQASSNTHFMGVGFTNTAGTEIGACGMGDASHPGWPNQLLLEGRGGQGVSFSVSSTLGGSANVAMRILGNGNVGIGTPNPGYRLDVSSSAGAAGSIPLRLKSTAPETGTLLFQIGAQANTENTIVSLDLSETASKNFTIAGWNLGNIAMIKLLANTLYVPGNVGIGTTNPGAYKLYVAGNAWSTGTWGGSDIRWKDNIEIIENPLPKLLRLRGVRYDWRRNEFKEKNFPDGRQIGIIAQELEKDFPELVSTDNDGYKSVAYDKFTAVLLEAIKEQQKEIEGLKSEIQRLKDG